MICYNFGMKFNRKGQLNRLVIRRLQDMFLIVHGVILGKS